MKMRMGKTTLTEFSRPYFIADIAANHDGDLDRALRLIELAGEAGADAVKFQNFRAETIVSKNGFLSLGKNLAHQADWDKTVYEVYQDASLNEGWTAALKEKCDEVGIDYLTTPYNLPVVDIVDPYVCAYKIGSGDITWPEMLRKVSSKNKPILLATGASNLEEVRRAVDLIKNNRGFDNGFVLMQCNTNYTASPENYRYINLNVLKAYRISFPDCILGLSDHTFGHATVLGAIALGAVVIEKHFTDNNNRVGPDHKFSMNPSTWREMVEEANKLYDALGDGIKKIEDNEKESAIVQRRSLFFKKTMVKGEIIKHEDLISLRPIHEDGLEPWAIDQVVGRKLNKDKQKDTYLRLEDLVDA